MIPVYNNLPGLEKTLTHIANGSLLPDRIFIVDDGSAQPVDLSTSDYRELCSVIRHPENLGISAGLNLLLSEAVKAGYEYAALIDAGDLPTHERLQIQLKAFQQFPEAAILGGNMRIISMDGSEQVHFNPPTTARGLHIAFRRGYPFAHPTAMFRLSNFTKYKAKYNTGIKASVDFELLYRLHLANPKSVANIPNILVDYIREKHSIGIERATLQAREAYKIRLKHLKASSYHSIAGLLDARLIMRAISAEHFFQISKAYRSAKKLVRRTR